MEKYDLIGYSKKVEVYPMGDLWRLLPIECIILWHKIRARHTQGLKDETLREECAHLLQDKEVWWYSALYLWWLIIYGYDRHPMELDAKEWRDVVDFETKKLARNYRKYK